jgi:K+-sensing histidine kinase KdpD
MMAITHELKTPIAVAKINLETLQLRKLDELQQQRIIQNTLQETNRLNALCNNMLVSSQMEAGGFRITNEEINISELVNNCINDFVSRFPQRKIKRQVMDELFVTGDTMLLQIAINNLADNAIKYSPKESQVSIELSNDREKVFFKVLDEGPGIAGTEKKKVFEKFYRAGNEATRLAKGTGLGLYITEKIVHSLKGKLEIHDNSPRGSIFVIELDRVV